jgi:hypothetical protein
MHINLMAEDRKIKTGWKKIKLYLRTQRGSSPTNVEATVTTSHACSSMITESFYEKADLEQWLKPDIHRSDYKDLTDRLWEPLIQKDLSFIVKAERGEPAGIALNFDANDEPPVEIASKLAIVFDFLEYLEGPIR